jgi:hypothetical protein
LKPQIASCCGTAPLALVDDAVRQVIVAAEDGIHVWRAGQHATKQLGAQRNGRRGQQDAFRIRLQINAKQPLLLGIGVARIADQDLITVGIGDDRRRPR